MKNVKNMFPARKKGDFLLAAMLLAASLSACQGRTGSGDKKEAASAVQSDASDGSGTEGEKQAGAQAQDTAEGTENGGLAQDGSAGTENGGLAQDGSAGTEFSFINPEGTVQQERIRTPEGYTRVPVEEGSFGEFLRTYPLEEDGAKVLLYDGSPKGNQSAHIAVYKLPVIDRADVQQCADSVMRMYAEYYYATGQAEKIAFHFVDGFRFDYASYRDGRRVNVGENSSSWTDGGSYDDSYERFENYLYITFAYSSTLSMAEECTQAKLSDVRAGDVFIRGGSPGHVVMVVDVCENANGERAFLLAQGYMPAQQFHILKNPAHEEDPWYYVDEIAYPFHTPEYTFAEGSFSRPLY